MQAEAAGLDRSLRVPVAVVAVAQRPCRVRRRAGLLIGAAAAAVLVVPVERVALAL